MAKRARDLGENWIDFSKAERVLSVSKSTLYRWKKDNAIVHQTVGGCCFAERSSLRDKIGHEHFDLKFQALENTANEQ